METTVHATGILRAKSLSLRFSASNRIPPFPSSFPQGPKCSNRIDLSSFVLAQFVLRFELKSGGTLTASWGNSPSHTHLIFHLALSTLNVCAPKKPNKIYMAQSFLVHIFEDWILLGFYFIYCSEDFVRSRVRYERNPMPLVCKATSLQYG